jgi:hypothetical protein
MADLAQLERALINAHNAGDTGAARMLAGEIQKLRTGAPKTYDPTEDMSTGQKVLAGAGKFMVDTARGAGQMLGLVDQKSIDESKALDAPLMNTTAGKVGNVVGGIATSLPAMFVPGANSMVGAGLLGGAMGALTPTASNESRLENVGMGAAGGMAGQAIANGIGRVMRPVRSKLSPELSGLAQTAQAEGIPLNVAQQTGSKPLKIINSVLDNLPFTADKQAADKVVQRSAFNRAVLSRVGESADTATPDVLNAARTRIGNQFEQLSARNNVALGNDFLNSIAQIDAGANAFTNPAVRSSVDKALDLAQRGTIDGHTYQNVRSTLSKQAKDAFSSGNSELGQALKTIQGALDDAATQSISAGDKAAWNAARSQYAALKAVEKAAAPTSADAVAGNISPAKLANVLMQQNKKGMVYGTGDQGLPDLARIGQAFIKDQIPDSGTAQRSLYQALMTGGAGLGGLMMANPVTALTAAGASSITPALIQALMRSPGGQQYLSQGLIAPTARNAAIGNMLRQGLVGGGAALPLSNGAE